MMRRPMLPLLAIALLAAGAGRAEAQSSPWQPERLTAGWTFTPGAALGTFRDSNVTLVPGRLLTPQAQWAVLVNPRSELNFVGRRTRFNAGYSGALETLRQGSDRVRYDQRTRVSASRTLSPRVAASAQGAYLLAPTTDHIQEEGITVLFADVSSRTLNASGGLTGALSRRTSLSATYAVQHVDFDYQDLDFDPAERLFRGGHFHMPGARLAHAVTPRATMDVAWTYTHGVVGGDVDAFGVQHVTGGLRYRVAEHTTVGGEGGASGLRVPATDVNRWEPTLRAYVEQQIGRTSFSVQFQRSVVPEFTYGALSSKQRLQASMNTPIVIGRSYLSAGLAFSRSEPVVGIARGLDARTIWVNGAVGYQVARWLAIEGFINSSRQTPIAADQSPVSRARVGVLFVTSKPMRIQ